MDFIFWLLIQFCEVLLDVLLTKVVEWLLKERNSNPTDQNKDN